MDSFITFKQETLSENNQQIFYQIARWATKLNDALRQIYENKKIFVNR